MTLSPQPSQVTTLDRAGALDAGRQGNMEAQTRRAITQMLEELVRGFSEQVAVVDEDWTVVAANDGWKDMVRLGDYTGLTTGTDYRDFLKSYAGKGHETAKAVLEGVNAIEAGETNSFELTYAGVDQWEGRTLQLLINRLHIGGRIFATITRQDITDSARLRELQEEFSSSVLESQAEERRRFARELHDSTSQLLVSMGLLLATLEKKPTRAEAAGLIHELKDLVGEAKKEIRAVSYLAFPPALEEMSLSEALAALTDGFARRTGLRASYQKSGKEIPLSEVAKSAMYRVAQEGLANVHRHAMATRVCVGLSFRSSTAHLIIIDDGIGFPPERVDADGRSGVGLAGMRSRLSEICGRLSIRRLVRGTAICASVPIRTAAA